MTYTPALTGPTRAGRRPTFAMPDGEEKLAKRKELAEGKLAAHLAGIEKVAASNPGKHVAGESLTMADLMTYVTINTLQSGKLDGIPTSIMDTCPTLTSAAALVREHPKVAAWEAKKET